MVILHLNTFDCLRLFQSGTVSRSTHQVHPRMAGTSGWSLKRSVARMKTMGWPGSQAMQIFTTGTTNDHDPSCMANAWQMPIVFQAHRAKNVKRSGKHQPESNKNQPETNKNQPETNKIRRNSSQKATKITKSGSAFPSLSHPPMVFSTGTCIQKCDVHLLRHAFRAITRDL